MFELVIRPLAKRDIKEIWKYSYGKWGKSQADSYSLKLAEAINTLVDLPERGIAIDKICEGYRQYRAFEHLVVYRLQKNKVEVVRVLGKRMDLSRHL